MANADISRLERQRNGTSRSVEAFPELAGDSGISWWASDPSEEDEPESRLGRLAYGVPNRVERLTGIGNAQVPAVAATAWITLIEMEDL